MLKKSAVQLLVVQMVAAVTTVLRTVRRHAAVTDAVATTALMSVANERVIVLLALKLWSSFGAIFKYKYH